MKILNLKFKNINSLLGENEIDFTQPVFTDNGLFAITGKTGSGKSSILDAISLALYGKTPRVEITGTENAVMTRGEKDCYCELVFEVAGKKWKSSWKQERTRTGNLKQVNRQIADFDDKIVADQVRSCDTKIVEIVGLTFEQFTKVILLAQGSFAAFLQADKNDKGELLEQITGTEIYGEISKNVFERNKIEKEKLDKILVELSAIKILSDEEIANVKSEIATFENDKKLIDSELQQIETAIKWLMDLKNLEKQIHEAKMNLPELQEKAEKAKTASLQAEQKLKSAKEELKIHEPVFKKIRELDTKITEKEKLLQPVLTSIVELETSKNLLSKTLDKQNSYLEQSKKTLSEKQDWLTKNQKYETLISNYSAVEKENQLLVNSLKEIKKEEVEINQLKKELELKKTDVKSASEIFEEKNQQLHVKAEEFQTKNTILSQILNGRQLSEYLSEKENITKFGIQITNLIDVEKAILKNEEEISVFDKEIKQFEDSFKMYSQKIEIDKKTLKSLENEINLLDENIQLAKTVQSLDQHRQNLKDGEACPLCGALEHPYSIGNEPKIGDKEKKLSDLKKQFQEKTNANIADERTYTKLISDKDNTLNNKEKGIKSLSEHNSKKTELLTALRNLQADLSIPKKGNRLAYLEEIHLQKQQQYKQISAIIKQAEDCEKQLINLRDKEIPALQKEKEMAEKSKNEAETAQKLVEQQFKNKQDLSANAQKKYEKEKAIFSQRLEIYGVESIESLKKCLGDWNNNKKQSEELTKEITKLSGDISLNKNELKNKTTLFEDKQRERQNIETDKKTLSGERKAIFGEKLAEDEEARLNKNIEDAEIAKSKTEKESSESIMKLEKSKAIIFEKEKEYSQKQQQKITDKSLDELQSESDEKKEKSAEYSQKIGGNSQALKANDENLKNSIHKLKEKEKQQEIHSKWGTLNELIGSADGKKYRNFAQALTFEHLIALANKQLLKMSDRYILKRIGDSSNPFELSVIDKFQNSEERTAKNLSGGEKFIVSLSLALGLANMASKNMRIDTMFIDEGFGTLDSDYLDVALSALSNLQSEGKIIGIISHLNELKERIATHVEVLPSGNGYSKVKIIG